MRVVDGEEEHLSPKCASSQYTGCEPKKEKKINHVSVKRKATLTQRVQKAMLDLDQYVDFSKSHTVH